MSWRVALFLGVKNPHIPVTSGLFLFTQNFSRTACSTRLQLNTQKGPHAQLCCRHQLLRRGQPLRATMDVLSGHTIVDGLVVEIPLFIKDLYIPGGLSRRISEPTNSGFRPMENQTFGKWQFQVLLGFRIKRHLGYLQTSIRVAPWWQDLGTDMGFWVIILPHVNGFITITLQHITTKKVQYVTVSTSIYVLL